MKKILLFALLIIIAGRSYGQYEFDLGIKTGLNNSRITVNTNRFTPSTINKYYIGAFARFNLNKIYIQPEVYYSSKGGNIKEIFSYNPLQTISSFNYDMFDVPLLVGIKIFSGKTANFRVLGGPVFSFITDSSVETTDPRFSASYFEDHFLGWQYGLGFDFLFITFDARIENSFGDIYTSSTLNSRNNTLLLSLGIKLL